jgi:hypothetical protein
MAMQQGLPAAEKLETQECWEYFNTYAFIMGVKKQKSVTRVSWQIGSRMGHCNKFPMQKLIAGSGRIYINVNVILLIALATF